MTASKHSSLPSILIVLVLLMGTLGLIALAHPRPVETADDDPALTNGAPETAIGTTNCRIGVSTGTGDVEAQLNWIPTLRVGWFLNFSVITRDLPSNVDFVPMIGVNQRRDADGTYLPGYTTNFPLTPDGLGYYVANNPGATWIVGNEVERTGQGDMFPAEYAKAYHDVYYFIKGIDPTAQVAHSALVQVTPGRLQYLSIVNETYENLFGVPMPVDVWTMHLYILPERRPDGSPNGIASVALGTDINLAIFEGNGTPNGCEADNVYCFNEHDKMDVFAEQVVAMRTWMRDNGYRNAPLLITEYSILYPYEVDSAGCFLQDEDGNCFTPQRISNFVTNSFAYLENATDPSLGMPADQNRLVQQWLWYSLNTELAGDSSDLVNEQLNGLTIVGDRFRNEVASRPLRVNLFGEDAAIPVVTTDGGSATATLSIDIRNNGNTYVNDSFVVSFFETGTNAFIGSTVVPSIQGCARHEQTVSVDWTGLGPGLHEYYAVIDAGNGVPESNEGDNIVNGQVLVDPSSELFIPSAGGGR